MTEQRTMAMHQHERRTPSHILQGGCRQIAPGFLKKKSQGGNRAPAEIENRSGQIRCQGYQKIDRIGS